MKYHPLILSALILAAPSLYGDPPREASKPMNGQQNAYEQSVSLATQQNKTLTFEIAYSGDKQIAEGTHRNPVLFIRVN
ncbi:hypothetical protein [Estrella lausannensis]|uniref:Putative secreted protein n=1 Tax=Estrella lausannensis TaxID=483423 RepID=A0A0H5DQF9_9BACT|nr:hypothetical protein [Estrella lausannensis]CRX38886.1 putative secreted protein [Estrella lausannensis]